MKNALHQIDEKDYDSIVKQIKNHEFEEELKRYQPMPEVNQAEEAIYNNDLRDISDIITQVTEEIKQVNASQANQYAGRMRR